MRVPALLLALAGFGLYLPTLSYEFTLDDPLVTTLNTAVAGPDVDYATLFTTSLYAGSSMDAGNRSVYRPLSKLTMVLNAGAIGGRFDPAWFHLGNLVLYGATILVVFAFFRRVFPPEDRYLAILATLLFAVFPSHVESVANVKHREELLACLFGLLSWIWFLRSLERGRRRDLLLTGVCFLAALFSKESALLLGVGMALHAGWRGQWRRSLQPLGSLGVATVCYLALRYVALGALSSPPGTTTFFTPDEDLLTRLGVGAWVMVRYYLIDQLGLLELNPAFSSRLLLLHDRSLIRSLLPGALLVGIAAWAGWSAFRRQSAAGRWTVWFLVTSLLTVHLVPIGTGGGFRLMFTPSVFLCGLIAAGVGHLHRWLESVRWLRIHTQLGGRSRATLLVGGGVVALVGYYAWGASSVMAVWRDDAALFEYAASLDWRNGLAQYAAGQVHDRNGDKTRALGLYNEALRAFEASANQPRLFDERTLDAFSVVATEVGYASLADLPERAVSLSNTAIAQFDRLAALRGGRRDPNAAAPYLVKALALRRLGRVAEALATCRAGLGIAEHPGLRQLLNELEPAAQPR